MADDRNDCRFEFRIFGPMLADSVETLETSMQETRVSGEANLYLLDTAEDTVNIKIRDRRLERKICIRETVEGLQQWRPDLALDFPLDEDVCLELFGITPDAPIGVDELLKIVGRPRGRAFVMHVRKSRRHFEADDVMGEYCELVVNGARLDSVAIESVNADALIDLRNTLGLSDIENTSYVTALSRLAGLSPLPAESLWRADR